MVTWLHSERGVLVWRQVESKEQIYWLCDEGKTGCNQWLQVS